MVVMMDAKWVAKLASPEAAWMVLELAELKDSILAIWTAASLVEF